MESISLQLLAVLQQYTRTTDACHREIHFLKRGLDEQNTNMYFNLNDVYWSQRTEQYIKMEATEKRNRPKPVVDTIQNAA